ncbi:Stk1 family PASTA domain-containing Ser/Thr kinase [Vagococcus xieshaowenii]|uniref:non-specific serine/threonine protein kinase n=1 Tax=Vagococcus xieshaowenii TaxID=2562451 RepID=A0AAJ5JKU6_9ENTE|nr:Stk1 family PASTA domain-containing Ser/Thr kinase [Vagococcus xieshaowenii]QCA28931.1 Stk1 family PASTA domain-containing Ser/Thr kinase [Vagococcus xieshaowenii]TFZ39256.1 Stk1 family PASTA domain-containing Ser/Thr kinase [Vagococcus xieshaowenii]
MVEIGNKINGRYRIIRSIGSGGMANVYLAYDLILDREVAVKVLRFDFLDDETAIRRFRREALAASELVHPNIVGIYDVGEEDNRQYLIMEYVKGTDLKKYIKENHPLSKERVIAIMQQVLSAIGLAHEHRIIHRDLKPQNILMDEAGNVKIADFGIAIALSETSLTQTNTLLGSVHYLSPEQARGSMATRQSDIYALGIILYELLVGKVPFEGESAVSIALKHFQSDMPSVREQLPDVPQSLENVILKATTKEPSDRYVSADEMAKDLMTCLLPERANEPIFKPKSIMEDETKRIQPISDAQVTKANQTNQLDKESDEITVEKPPKIEPKKKKRRGGKIGLLLMLGVLAVLAGVWLAPSGTTIPDVSGQTIDEAITLLEDKGFKVSDDYEEAFSETVKADRVISTSPRIGTRAFKSEKIILTVSKGSEKIEIGNYIGSRLTDAKKELLDLGFTDDQIKIDEVEDPDYEPGVIVSQSPAEGSKISLADGQVELKVSVGTETIILENLTGYTLTEAINYLNGQGLGFTQATSEFSNSIPENSVISTSPGAGASLVKGNSVMIVLSKGPEPVETVESSEEPEVESTEESSADSESSEESTEESTEDSSKETSSETSTSSEVAKEELSSEKTEDSSQ